MSEKPGRSLREKLADLDDWTGKVAEVVSACEKGAYPEDEILVLALSRVVEVVGEIAGQIAKVHPHWSKSVDRPGLNDAYRMRNRLSHGYDQIDPMLLLEIARQSVPELRRHVGTWLSELDDGQP